MSRTFCSNIWCSILKLLFILARLCEQTPLQQIILKLFGINFPSHSIPQLPFLTFHGQDFQQNKVKGVQRPWDQYAHQPPHTRNIAPPSYLPLTPIQGKRKLHHFALPSYATEGTFPLCVLVKKYSTLFLPFAYHHKTLPRSSYPTSMKCFCSQQKDIKN